MIHLALQSEFTFQRCFYHLHEIVSDAKTRGAASVGVADINNTYAHIKFSELCAKADIKPIFGVKVLATDTKIDGSRSLQKSANLFYHFTIIAKNQDGLVELNKLVTLASKNFYYAPRVTFNHIFDLSDNVLVLAEYAPTSIIADRIDYVIVTNKPGTRPSTWYLDDKPKVCIPLVQYPRVTDRGTYELLAGRNSDLRSYPTHLQSVPELLACGVTQDEIDRTHEIADMCNATPKKAEMVKYYKKNISLRDECIKGAFRLKINLDDPVYKERFEREMKLIEMRDFQDYFLIVSDILMWTKRTNLVGPGRGSSGGSLVCYLMGITEIDPIEHGLLFERFIDINRSGLPDIDTDIPDVKRPDVIKYLASKYGKEKVMSIGTIATLKPKSALDDFSKGLGIPFADVEHLKKSIINRSSGDARAALCIADTLSGTDAGVEFTKVYPEIRAVERIEGHARHYGKHAAGIIVANEPLYNFVGTDTREDTIMTEGYQAEANGLLKIDILGLRTLTILEETAEIAGFDYKDYYRMDYDDRATFEIFNQGRTRGIFQFEGKALSILTSQMGVENFDDICAITALGRPGALNTGAAARYIKYRSGKEEPNWLGGIYDEITAPTYGEVIYQEQVMRLLKDYGNLSWEDVNMLRRALSKSYGDEFFARYKDKFINGAIEMGRTPEEAKKVWDAVGAMGSYGFNKSHAVAYSIISYWTAWAKAHHPLEFAAANLNHSKGDGNAVKLLRDFVVHDGLDYIPVDPDTSLEKWSIVNGKLVGGLRNISGIGPKMAKQIVKARKTGERMTKSMVNKLIDPKTEFDVLFPTKHYFREIYENPVKYGVFGKITDIKDIDRPQDYNIIGKVIKRDIRDRNDVQSVIKRGGKKVDKNQYYLNLLIEDDTETIRCSIPPFKYEEMNGKEVAESMTEGEAWCLISGKVQGEWRSISIERIEKINHLIKE